jgi:hypothetical protein
VAGGYRTPYRQGVILRSRYTTGSILAATILISLTIMYSALTAPVMARRVVAIFDEPLMTFLGMHELLLATLHVGLLACGVLLLAGRVRCARWAIGLIWLIWMLNVVRETAFHAYDLIMPTTGFAVFASIPLLIVWALSDTTAREIPSTPSIPMMPGFLPPRPAARRRVRLALLAECFASSVILGLALSVALASPFDSAPELEIQERIPPAQDRATPVSPAVLLTRAVAGHTESTVPPPGESMQPTTLA